MESIIVACITGVVTLSGVILSNSKSRSVMEVKLDALTAKVEKRNQVLERTYQLEQDMAVAKHDIGNGLARGHHAVADLLLLLEAVALGRVAYSLHQYLYDKKRSLRDIHGRIHGRDNPERSVFFWVEVVCRFLEHTTSELRICCVLG